MYDLKRFIDAQDRVYSAVIKELKRGKKVSHWMWFIFPQLRKLGESQMSQFYGISGLLEAKAYCHNSILIERYLECCTILLSLDTNDIEEVLDYVDGLKLKSSLTLFLVADAENQELYLKLLEKYYNGKKCEITIKALNREKKQLNI